MESLKGKVVLLDFWTYSCVSCIRTLPHMHELHVKYPGDRFVVVGVHTPNYEFEKSPENVADAVKRFRIEYPVAVDSANATWRLYGNQYWPRQTLVDARGRVRWEHAGEGDYERIAYTKQVGSYAIANPNDSTEVQSATSRAVSSLGVSTGIRQTISGNVTSISSYVVNGNTR